MPSIADKDMKKFFALFAFVAVIAGCKSGSPALFIAPNPITIEVGESANFIYGVKGYFDTCPVEADRIKVEIVDADACLAVSGNTIKGVKAGDALLTISYDDPVLEASAVIHVTDPPAEAENEQPAL